MSKVKEYFDKTTYKSVYFLGDRVKGKWNKKLFTGTVANDHLVSLEEGPVVHVFLDSALLHNGSKINFITTRHTDIKLIK
jgi:hypothetical protein